MLNLYPQNDSVDKFIRAGYSRLINFLMNPFPFFISWLLPLIYRPIARLSERKFGLWEWWILIVERGFKRYWDFSFRWIWLRNWWAPFISWTDKGINLLPEFIWGMGVHSILSKKKEKGWTLRLNKIKEKMKMKNWNIKPQL